MRIFVATDARTGTPSQLQGLPRYSTFYCTPARTLFISGLKSQVLKLSFLSLKMMVKSGLEFILKLTQPLQSCCCPVQKFCPERMNWSGRLEGTYLKGLGEFQNKNPRQLFTIIFMTKMVISRCEILVHTLKEFKLM